MEEIHDWGEFGRDRVGFCLPVTPSDDLIFMADWDTVQTDAMTQYRIKTLNRTINSTIVSLPLKPSTKPCEFFGAVGLSGMQRRSGRPLIGGDGIPSVTFSGVT